jgi:hypothetical protein
VSIKGTTFVINSYNDMTKEQENELLNALENVRNSKEYNRLVDIVSYMEGEGIDCPSIERTIDEVLICRGAWIYDKLNGKPKRGKSFTMIQKIRKVLGYTNP